MLEVLEIDFIQPLQTEQVLFYGCDIESGKLVNQTMTTLPSLPYYTSTGADSGHGERSLVLKYLLQDPEFGKSRGRIKVAWTKYKKNMALTSFDFREVHGLS